MSEADRERADPVTLAPMTDAEIVARIAEAVQEPFAAAWRRHREHDRGRIGRILEQAVSAHERALATFAEGTDDGNGSLDAAAAERVLAEYRRDVSRNVLKPLHLVLRHGSPAVTLHRSLVAAGRDAREALRALPEAVEAPVSPDALTTAAGLGPGTEAKRLWARLLRPHVWKLEVHEVAVRSVARRYLECDVLPRQSRAFRASQRARAGWLGRVERAWAVWTRAVLLPPKGRTGAEEPGAVEAAGAGVAAAEALQGELAALRDGVGWGAGGDFRRSSEVLAATVAVAGTFVAPRRAPAMPVQGDEGLAGRWDDWAKQAAGRLQLHLGLLAMRAAAHAIGARLVGHWRETNQRVHAVLDRIGAALDDGVVRAEGLPEGDDGLRRVLASERARTAGDVSEPTATLNDPAPFLRDVAGHAEEAIEDLVAMNRQLPEVALHDLPDAGQVIRRPDGDSRVVQTRELAVQAFDTLRMERIRTAPSAIADAWDAVGTAVRELGVVSDYAYEAALGELADGADGGPGSARVLVTNGLTRAGDKLASARAELRTGLEVASSRVRDEIGEGAVHLVRRVTADRLRAGYLDARTYLATEVAQDWKQWRGGVAESGRRAWDGVRALGRRAGGLLSALGIRPQPARTLKRTEDTLASAAKFVRTLPVVYQRLFAFEPLTDPQFLAGRDDELAEVEATWARWNAGGPGCLVVVDPPGAGVTSFLNVVSTRLSDEEPRSVRRILRDRCRDEAGLAARIAPWLGLDGTATLDDLAKSVMASTDGSVPRLVTLEGIEHLHMRAPEGGRLFRRFMTFVSRTESSIFWILSMTSSAWQLVRTRAPEMAGETRQLVLQPLSPDELRRAITSRHLRSGLPLQYVEPRAGADALRTRARRLHTTDRQQQLIEKNYFERLHRASLGSIRLALFHWLRSADFTTVEGSLLVRPLEPLSPPTDTLDLTRSFALKAILDHGTLSASEYCEVFRTSARECAHTLRSLEENHFIEDSRPPDEEPRSPGEPTREVRYGLRPLMTGAVIAHLRSRNILH